jgi:hypothetical protein
MFQCLKMIVAIVKKIVEKCPLKFKIVRGLSALDPAVISYSTKLGICRIKDSLLEPLHDANRISASVAERAQAQYEVLCDDAKVP